MSSDEKALIAASADGIYFIWLDGSGFDTAAPVGTMAYGVDVVKGASPGATHDTMRWPPRT